MYKHVNLIRSIAWSFHRSTGIDWKELFSEATAAYFQGLKFHRERHGIELHDPKKGGETTWIYQWVTSEMINFCKKEQKCKYVKGIDDWVLTTTFPDPFQEINPPLLNLSQDTREIVQMVLQDPHRYALPPRKAIGQIRKDLREIKKWSWTRIETGMRNLRSELKEPISV